MEPCELWTLRGPLYGEVEDFSQISLFSPGAAFFENNLGYSYIALEWGCHCLPPQISDRGVARLSRNAIPPLGGATPRGAAYFSASLAAAAASLGLGVGKG